MLMPSMCLGKTEGNFTVPSLFVPSPFMWFLGFKLGFLAFCLYKLSFLSLLPQELKFFLVISEII